MSLMESADNYKDVCHAALLFGRLGNYLDSVEKYEYCKKQGKDMKEKYDAEVAQQEEMRRQEIARQQEEQRCEGVYREQRSRLMESNHVQTLLNAAEDLEFLGDYKDARELARQCKEKAARITAEHKEREEAEARKKVQQAQWRNAGLCQYCGGTLKGFFSKKCTNCGKAKDY